MNRRRGFSLIELMVVMAILTILGALAYPGYAGYMVRIKRTEGQAALLEAMQAQERHYARHSSYLAFASDAPDPAAQAFRWWSGESAARSAYELDGHACPGRTLADCIEIRARPGTAKVDARFRDPDCGALTLDSLGMHGAQGPQAGQAGAGSAVRCWP